MGRLKKTPKSSMKYWRVYIRGKAFKVKARTARTALRKMLRGNLDHEILMNELELNNYASPTNETPGEILAQRPKWRRLLTRLRPSYAQSISVKEWSR